MLLNYHFQKTNFYQGNCKKGYISCLGSNNAINFLLSIKHANFLKKKKKRVPCLEVEKNSCNKSFLNFFLKRKCAVLPVRATELMPHLEFGEYYEKLLELKCG